ncbi:MAG: transcriptional regulator [Candidatus Brockarchaeota archaeon]|nr:transcriptional regulator [Candidatus Brockarchaeota archaeon]
MARTKRSRIELYADVLNALRVHHEGCRITKLSYGANMPVDRMKKTVEELISHGLVARSVEDAGIYVLTLRGWDFLEAFKKLAMFLE